MRRVGTAAPSTWLLGATVAVAALLRLATLGHQSLWADEAVTVHEVSLSFGSMLASVGGHEATPPLYYVLAWVWTRLFGAGAVGIRSLSAVAGIALVPALHLAGRELVSRRAGLIAAGLAAISPFLIWYSQEARAYALLGLLSALSLWLVGRARRTGAARDLGAFAVVAALALATHFFAALLVAGEALWLLLARRDRGTLLALGGVLVAAAALAPLAISDAGHRLDVWIGGLPRHVRIEAIPVEFAASQLYTTSSLRWGGWGTLLLAAVALGLIAVATPGQRRRLALPAGLVGLVVGVPLLGAALGADFVFARNLTPAWIPLAVLIGGLADAAGRPRLGRPLGAALVLGLAAVAIVAQVRIGQRPSLQRPDWRDVARALGPPTVPRAIAVTDGNLGEEPLSVYLPGTRFSFSGTPAPGPSVSLREIDVVTDLGSAPAPSTPDGLRPVGERTVGTLVVLRYRVPRPLRLTPAGVATLAAGLVEPGAGSAVLVQAHRVTSG